MHCYEILLLNLFMNMTQFWVCKMISTYTPNECLIHKMWYWLPIKTTIHQRLNDLDVCNQVAVQPSRMSKSNFKWENLRLDLCTKTTNKIYDLYDKQQPLNNKLLTRDRHIHSMAILNMFVSNLGQWHNSTT